MEIEKFQPHIPSSQTVPRYEYAGKQISITPFQFDAMNYICFEAQKQISQNYGLTETKQIAKSDDLKLEQIKKHTHIENSEDLFNFLRNQVIDIDLNFLSSFTNKYGGNNKSHMIKELYKLQDTKVTIGQIRQDTVSNSLHKSRFPLISRIEIISNKLVQVRLEHELIFGWIFEAIPFNKILIKNQAILSTMCAKQLYSICSEYMWLGKIDFEFENFKDILNLKAPNISKLKGNHLNKAIDEINEKTDIEITNCYGKKLKGKNTIFFEFIQHKTSEPSLKDDVMHSKKMKIATQRLNMTKQLGKQITNEDAWLKKTISSISDEQIEKFEKIEIAKEKLSTINLELYGNALYNMFGDHVGMDNFKLNYIFKNTDDKDYYITHSAEETLHILENLTDD